MKKKVRHEEILTKVEKKSLTFFSHKATESLSFDRLKTKRQLKKNANKRAKVKRGSRCGIDHDLTVFIEEAEDESHLRRKRRSDSMETLELIIVIRDKTFLMIFGTKSD